MEKAEAIKILKYRHDISLPFERKALETLIPELKESEESEEERVRKDIVGLIKFALNDGSAVSPGSHTTKEEAISWLEKQKEEPQEELVYRLNGLMQEYIKEGKDDAEKEHRFKCYQLFWDALEDADFFEQKELRSAEWNEEDETIRHGIECLIMFALQDGSSIAPGCATTKEQALNWLKSLRPSWRPSEDEECKNSK